MTPHDLHHGCCPDSTPRITTLCCNHLKVESLRSWHTRHDLKAFFERSNVNRNGQRKWDTQVIRRIPPNIRELFGQELYFFFLLKKLWASGSSLGSNISDLWQTHSNSLQKIFAEVFFYSFQSYPMPLSILCVKSVCHIYRGWQMNSDSSVCFPRWFQRWMSSNCSRSEVSEWYNISHLFLEMYF